MAVALSTRLGLHIDTTNLVEKNIMPQHIQASRDSTFWAVFTLDMYVSALSFIPHSLTNLSLLGYSRRTWASTPSTAGVRSPHPNRGNASANARLAPSFQKIEQPHLFLLQMPTVESGTEHRRSRMKRFRMRCGLCFANLWLWSIRCLQKCESHGSSQVQYSFI